MGKLYRFSSPILPERDGEVKPGPFGVLLFYENVRP
jgi:hypothetical protein